MAFWNHIDNADYHINQFVFIDESHVDDRSVNRYFGHSFYGHRAVFKQLFRRGERYTVTAALDLDGIVDYAIISGICQNIYLQIYHLHVFDVLKDLVRVTYYSIGSLDP